MTVIDIGSDAIDRPAFDVPEYTCILKDNPANATGTLTKVEIWAYTGMTGCKAGTFYGSGTDYTSRDYETIGGVTAGSKQTFSGLDCDVTTGDYIGAYWATGNIEAHNSGYAGLYWIKADKFGAGATTYTFAADLTYSLYGEGETEAVAEELGAFYQRRNPFSINIQTAGQVRGG